MAHYVQHPTDPFKLVSKKKGVTPIEQYEDSESEEVVQHYQGKITSWGRKEEKTGMVDIFGNPVPIPPLNMTPRDDYSAYDQPKSSTAAAKRDKKSQKAETKREIAYDSFRRGVAQRDRRQPRVEALQGRPRRGQPREDSQQQEEVVLQAVIRPQEAQRCEHG